MTRVRSVLVWIDRALCGEISWFRIVLHVAVIAGLLVTLGIAQLAERYFTRGVASGTDLEIIPYTDVNPMGVNTFLNEEVDPEVVERSLDMVAEGGFGYIRQMFGWFEIEPERDIYVDKDGNSTWEKYDRIVELANERNIEIIARLEKPPRWARAGQPNVDQFPDGPPNWIEDWIDYVATVVDRYRGKVTYFQLWNEPNLQGEWGGLPIDPRGYVDLLEAGYRAAKKANPEAVILLAGLAPTDQTGPENLSDLLFLQRIYDYGGKEFFDIATVMVYGYGYSPYDRRVEFDRNNFSRPIQTREIMVANGDADKPIWAAEYGWVSLPEDWEGEPSPWGGPVSRKKQAEYLVEGYLRAQREWSWMGVMNVWTLRFELPQDHPDEVGNPNRGFALLDYDFTPTRAYLALQENAGRIQLRSTGNYAAPPEIQNLSKIGRPIRLSFSGERLDIAVDTGDGGVVEYEIDGRRGDPLLLPPGRSEEMTIMTHYPSGYHEVTLSLLSDPTDNPPVLASFLITRYPISTWIYPWIDTAILVILGLVVASLGWAVWDRRRVASAVGVDEEAPESVSIQRARSPVRSE